jgi:phospholipid/cholesterol/gamma-HCH transport system substrate-binding protein
LLEQLAPDVEGLGNYRGELNAFFANSASATNGYELTKDGKRLHYLRVINPITAENLAAYPRRIGSNRTLPYLLLGAASPAKLRQGLDSYETRHCGRPNPSLAPDTTDPATISPADAAVVPAATAQFLQEHVFGGASSGATLAPPCRAQAPFPMVFGSPDFTQYPQLRNNFRQFPPPTPFSPRPPTAEVPDAVQERLGLKKATTAP